VLVELYTRKEEPTVGCNQNWNKQHSGVSTTGRM
jgi:hypothetical protein